MGNIILFVKLLFFEDTFEANDWSKVEYLTSSRCCPSCYQG